MATTTTTPEEQAAIKAFVDAHDRAVAVATVNRVWSTKAADGTIRHVTKTARGEMAFLKVYDLDAAAP